MRAKLSHHYLKLGSYYDLNVNDKFIYENLKFIKVTKSGYNFLDEKTNKCVLFSNIYACKYNEGSFVAPIYIKIKKHIKE